MVDMFAIDNAFSYGCFTETWYDNIIIDFVHENKYRKVSIEEINDFLDENNICYHLLSQKMKDELDLLDCY